MMMCDDDHDLDSFVFTTMKLPCPSFVVTVWPSAVMLVSSFLYRSLFTLFILCSAVGLKMATGNTYSLGSIAPHGHGMPGKNPFVM